MRSDQKGLTLIELMIAMLLGLMVTATAITIFMTSLISNNDHMSMLHLNQDMRTAMTLITRELRMANSDEDIIYAPTSGYACDACALSYNAGVLSLSYYKTAAAAVQTTTFQLDIDSSAIEFNDEQITLPDNDFTDLTITLTAGDDENPEFIDISMTAQTALSGDVVASRTLTKRVRIRN